MKAEAGLPKLASAGGEVTRDISAQKEEAAARVYDPLWTNALTFLDRLNEKGLIQRGLNQARIGQFLLVTGRIAITDLAMIRRSMDLPAIKKLIVPQKQGNRQQRRAAEASGQIGPTQLQDMAMEMLTVLPHTVQGRIYTNTGDVVWSTLDRSSLVIGPEDLFLKHGVAIGGDWAMLGIVDALPGEYGNLDGELGIMTEIDPENPGGELMAKLAAAIVPFSKLFLGRPDAAYGVTPLLIFREVSGE